MKIQDKLIAYCPWCQAVGRDKVYRMSFSRKEGMEFRFVCIHPKCDYVMLCELDPDHKRYGT